MKLSTRSTYAMRALVELAFAGGRAPLSASAIAARQRLSVAYLEQLLHRLKKAGLVGSVRGPRGGYILRTPPHQISMGTVVRALDGGFDTVNGAAPARPSSDLRRARSKTPRRRASGANGTRPESKELARHAARIERAVWRCVHERLAQSLDAVTLQDLCDEVRTAAGDPLDHRYVFHI